MDNLNVCLLNDSFPPLIDGVANTVVNYANILTQSGNTVSVVTPNYPDADDSGFPFPVLRYPSLPTAKLVGYRAGYPFSPETLKQIRRLDTHLIHSHCPFASSIMARSLRNTIDAPLVFTYHTKFDIDIANAIKGKLLQESIIKILVQNISASDEVWVVSKGAGENLRSLGYTGEYTVMPNGVDYPKGRVDEASSALLRAKYADESTAVFLYVGRMMWYKNIAVTLDAVRLLKQSGTAFKMLFVGGGSDFDEIKKYAFDIGIADVCEFVGPVLDRELLRTYYCAADAFLFPSTYDTNGLVVREAAASGIASVLVKGSCAAENVTDGRNGFFIDETPEALCKKLIELAPRRAFLREVGQNAMNEIYISWEDAVSRAMVLYRDIIKRYKNGEYQPHKSFSDEFCRLQGELMSALARANSLSQAFRGRIDTDE